MKILLRLSTKARRVALTSAILTLGVGSFAALLATAPQPEIASPVVPPTVVHTITVRSAKVAAQVPARGRVIPAQQLELRSELSGRVSSRHPELIPGAIVPAGVPLVTLDTRQLELAVWKHEAEVQRRQLALDLERARQELAEEEWRHAGIGGDASALALRLPQLRAAENDLEAAHAELAQARLQLDKAALTSPFHALVLSVGVEVGQLVGPADTLATLVAADRFWVELSISARDAAALPSGERAGALVKLADAPSRGARHWQGNLLRTLPEVDPAAQQIRVLAEVRDPVGNAQSEPLLLGAFVNATISGRDLGHLIELPRHALQSNQRVLVVRQGHLDMVDVQVLWRERDHIYVSEGLLDGDEVVVGPAPPTLPGQFVLTLPRE